MSQEPFFSRASLYNAQIPDDQDMVENTSAADLRPGSGCNQGRAGGHTKTYADDVENNRTTSTLQKDGKEELNAWKDAKYGKIFKLKNCELQAGSSGAKSKIQKNIEGSPVKLSPFTKIVNKQMVYLALLFLTANVTAAWVAIVSNS